jgi:hypothetical protein
LTSFLGCQVTDKALDEVAACLPDADDKHSSNSAKHAIARDRKIVIPLNRSSA